MSVLPHAAVTDSWTAWQSGVPPVRASAAALAEILSGGQAFRWRRVAGTEHVWQGTWADCHARLRAGADESLEWSAPAPLAGRVAASLGDYLAADMDFVALTDALPWRTDAVLRERLAAWPGLRLLRQPLGETLLAFLCSSAKQIPHIAQLCERLAQRFGEPVWEGVRALPEWPRLAEIPEKDLRACGLGYRARFIHQVAQKLAAASGWAERLPRAPYPEAHAWLTALPGVGPKIADCVLLFGAGQFEAFPVDTWILRAMAERYGLRGWRPAQVAQFGRAHFGPLAGLAQQFLFSGERQAGKKR
jgi:N-glycosylase/DNA lyase